MQSRKVVFFFLMLICLGRVAGQNLVPNPSFETYDICPTNFGQIYHAIPWFQPSTYNWDTRVGSSSEFYNACVPNVGPAVSTPNNAAGYQIPKTGLGYAGIYEINDSTNYREYIEIQLLAPLNPKESYCVSFYVSFSCFYGGAISNLGAFFSVDSLLDNRATHAAIDYVTPQIENPVGNILSDTTNWMYVSGSFVATGGESFLTIGNFHATTNTNYLPVSGSISPDAYYYIDNVNVHCCTCDSLSHEGINEQSLSEDLSISPNPANTSITLTLPAPPKENTTFELKDILGQSVYRSFLSSQTTTIDVSAFAKGIYFLQVAQGNKKTNKKIVVQ